MQVFADRDFDESSAAAGIGWVECAVASRFESEKLGLGAGAPVIIGAPLVAFVAWANRSFFTSVLMGLAANTNGWTRQFEDNTEGERDVLSVEFLGRESLRCKHLMMKYQELLGAFDRLTDLIRLQALAA